MLYDKNKPWTKRGKSNFDIQWAETCELVGLVPTFATERIRHKCRAAQGRSAFCNKNERQTEPIKKETCNIFKKNNLKVTTEANHKTVQFFKCHIKPNDK